MSGFSADWLRLREPFDHQARQAAFDALGLPSQLERWRRQGGDPTLSVVDLACGSGSNLRALAPRLGGHQRWRLIDHDPALLAAVPGALADWATEHGHQHVARGQGHIKITGPGFKAEVTLENLDLARDLAKLDLTHTQLVTGSALLDLVSANWLQALVRQARESGTAMLFALNVDGHTAWSPPDPQDQALHRLFESHQGRDKGFGSPALGGQAVPLAQRLMREAGYAVNWSQSDWVIDAGNAHEDPAGNTLAMLTAMIEGQAEAALEQAQALPQGTQASIGQAIPLWQTRRMAALPSTRLQVGHVDLFATLP